MLENEINIHETWNAGVKTREYIDKIRLAEEVSQCSEEEDSIERYFKESKDTPSKPMEYIALTEAVPGVQYWPTAA